MLRLSLCLVAIFLTGVAVCGPAAQARRPDEDDFLLLPRESKEDEEEPTERSSDEGPSYPPEIQQLIDLRGNSTDNNSSSDLFVIKTVVYEIGILTDVGNDTDFDNETHEQIDVSFFDPVSNGSFVDLSHVPVPIQTNVSGVSVTGFAPANLGDLALLKNGTPTVEGSHFPRFPNKQVRVTHNVTTFNKDNSDFVLAGLPEILGLKDLVKYDHDDDDNDSSESGSKKKEGKIVEKSNAVKETEVGQGTEKAAGEEESDRSSENVKDDKKGDNQKEES